MMRDRLELALERLSPEQWRIFEEFASSFLSAEFPSLRTMASPGGDGGRDAQLFASDGPIETVFQYSVTTDWSRKVKETAKRVAETVADTRVLVYVTNQLIGARADELRRELRDCHGFVLDVYDRSWFLDRFQGDEQRLAAAEELAIKVVDPILMKKGVLGQTAPTLSDAEAQAALTFLQLQWENDTRDRGLTKFCFQALVRMVLRSTDSGNRLGRNQVQEQIVSMFPNHDAGRVRSLVDGALQKLTKVVVRHWTKEDEFCLTFAESERVRDGVSKIELADSDLKGEIRETVQKFANDDDDVGCLQGAVLLAVDRYLHDRGEVFAAAITNEQLADVGVGELRQAVQGVVHNKVGRGGDEERVVSIVVEAIVELFAEPSPRVRAYLRTKADAYTLFAFLGRTPDVQRAVAKMFSHGTIWLDTTIALPLFAEQLDAIGDKRFTRMLKTAHLAGLELRVTPGVIEELERHMNRCLAYARARPSDWVGHVPFLIDVFVRTGRSLEAFAPWIENFRGNERPADDVAEWLSSVFGANLESLEDETGRASSELRSAVTKAWIDAHMSRRDPAGQVDEGFVRRLADHDVENYLGVVQRRSQGGTSALGYSTWWLTLDSQVLDVERAIRKSLGFRAPPTPVMRADFLVNYLAIGPVRGRITKDLGFSLPLVVDVGFVPELAEGLIDEANRLRAEVGSLPEHIVRRRVRDSLDRARRHGGRMQREGMQHVIDSIGRNA